MGVLPPSAHSDDGGLRREVRLSTDSCLNNRRKSHWTHSSHPSQQQSVCRQLLLSLRWDMELKVMRLQQANWYKMHYTGTGLLFIRLFCIKTGLVLLWICRCCVNEIKKDTWQKALTEKHYHHRANIQMNVPMALLLTYRMMTSSNGNVFRVTGHLCEEFTGPRWIPRTKVSDAGLWCFLWSASE